MVVLREALDSSVTIQGIFATHLHQLLTLPLNVNKMTKMRMETRGTGQYVTPTWRMLPGECTNSLALSVALGAGIEQQLVDEAQRLTQVLTHRKAGLTALSTAGSDAHSRHTDASDPGSSSSSNGNTGSRCSSGDITQLSHSASSPYSNSSSSSGGGDSWQSDDDIMTAGTAATVGSNDGDMAAEAGSEERPVSRRGEIERMFFQDDALVSHRHPLDELGAPDTAGDQLQTGIVIVEEATAAALKLLVGPGTRARKLKMKVVAPNKTPPASTVGKSCVYLCLRRDGWGYCGQSDDLRGRLKKHRQLSSVYAGGPSMLFAYLVIPTDAAGQSAARAVETAAIKLLNERQWNLISDRDGGGRLTPGSR